MTERSADESVRANEHIPVLLQEVLTHLVGRAQMPEGAAKESGIFIDATFGRGGHSRKLLEHLSAQSQLLGLDRDPEALVEHSDCLNKTLDFLLAAFRSPRGAERYAA